MRLSPGKPGQGWALALLLLAISAAGYLRTLRPTFGWLDSSELATAACCLGIGHNPGYPTLMLLAHPWRWLPLGEVAYRLNLFSAAAGSLAVVLVYLAALRICRSRAAAAVAALSLAFSRTFWQLTTELDVHTLHACFLAGLLLCLLKWRGGEGRGWLAAAAVLWGLGMGNHPLTLLAAPSLLYLATASRSLRWLGRRLPALAGGAGCGLLVYLYVPIRAAANPPPALNNPHSLHEFWQLVSAPAYREFMFAMPLAVVLRRVAGFSLHLGVEFGLAGVLLGVLGAGALWRRDRPLFWSLALLALLTLAYAANYNIFDIYAYLLGLYLVWALWLAVGAEVALRRGGALVERWSGTRASVLRPGRGKLVVGTLLLAVPALLFAANLGVVDASDDYAAEDFARAALAVAAPGALIIGDWYSIAPLGYLQHVEGVRPDVRLSAAFSASPATRARVLSQDRLARYPAVYTAEQQTCYNRAGASRYPTVPAGPLLRVYAAGAPSLPSWREEPSLPPRYSFGGVFGLLRARLVPARVPLGRLVRLQLDWLKLRPTAERYELFLEVARGQGPALLSQKTLLAFGALPAGRWQPGTVVREEHLLYVPSDAEPGRYALRLRLRPQGGWALRLQGEGSLQATVGELAVTTRPRRER